MLMTDGHISFCPIRVNATPHFMLARPNQLKTSLPQHLPELPICDHNSQPQKFSDGFFAAEPNDELRVP